MKLPSVKFDLYSTCRPSWKMPDGKFWFILLTNETAVRQMWFILFSSVICRPSPLHCRMKSWNISTSFLTNGRLKLQIMKNGIEYSPISKAKLSHHKYSCSTAVQLDFATSTKMHGSVCVCVCVCVWKKNKKSERGSKQAPSSIRQPSKPLSQALHV